LFVISLDYEIYKEAIWVTTM